MSGDATGRTEQSASRASVVVVVAVFAILFGIEVFEAVSNLVALPVFYASLGLGDETPWIVLIAGVALPVLAFAGSLVLARGRALFARALILVIALAATNAIALTLAALVQFLRQSIGT